MLSSPGPAGAAGSAESAESAESADEIAKPFKVAMNPSSVTVVNHNAGDAVMNVVSDGAYESTPLQGSVWAGHRDQGVMDHATAC